MSGWPEFPHLEAKAAVLASNPHGDLSAEDLRALLCHDCDFWHDEHEDDLECSSYRIVKSLLLNRTLTPAALAAALKRPRAE